MDPFAIAGKRLMKVFGKPCTVTRADGSRVEGVRAELAMDVELVDDLGQIIDRADMISLLVADVPSPKSGEIVKFTETGRSYELGRRQKDDGVVVKLLAHRSA